MFSNRIFYANFTLLCLCLCLLMLSANSQPPTPTYDEYRSMYRKAPLGSSRSYDEKKEAFEQRVENMRNITEYTPAINKFTDLTRAEMENLKNGGKQFRRMLNNANQGPKISTTNLGTSQSVNWVELGMVTSVKDQGSCGSCWAFATVAQAESTLILNNRTNATIDLSEQYILECTPNSDCDGTYYVNYAMESILGGVPLDSAYPYNPYVAHNGICEESQKIMVSDDYHEYYDISESQLISLLQLGPLVVVVSADNWEYYGSGIFSCPSWAGVNHVVQLVGYTQNYWLVKNQWGEDWGEEGYMKIARSSNEVTRCFLGSQVFFFKRDSCSLLGCQVCSTDLTCLSCKDSTATLENGNCSCPEGLSFNQFGSCVTCQVEHCLECDPQSSTICTTCKSALVFSNSSGQCQCLAEGFVMNSEGNCQLCSVQGCKMCESGNPDKCEKCSDCSSFLENGRCLCPALQSYNANTSSCNYDRVNRHLASSDCNVYGCLTCEPGEPDVCDVCIETWSFILNGQCNCMIPNEMINSQGMCTICMAIGCTSCLANSTTHCYRCLDQVNSIIVDGVCRCAPGFTMNSTLFCQTCHVEKCNNCVDNNSEICFECQEGYDLNIYGLCQCSNSSLQINELGLCSACDLEGCMSCSSQDPSLCLQCLPGLIQINNLCACPFLGQRLNSQRYCELCNVPGCLACETGLPNICQVCQDGMNLNSGYCVCSDLAHKLNSEGFCEPCNVAGCAVCLIGQPDVCIRCTDCGSWNHHGNCECEFHDQVLNIHGFCTSPASNSSLNASVPTLGTQSSCTSGCASCSNNVCTACAQKYFMNSGQCYKCDLFCTHCTGPHQCLQAYEGFTVVNGDPKKCSTLHCQHCEPIDICTSCKVGYTLNMNTCIRIQTQSLSMQANPWISFEEFIEEFNKNYSSHSEYEMRQRIYESNLEVYGSLQNEGFTANVSHLSDLTEEELRTITSSYHYTESSHERAAKIKQRRRVSSIGDSSQYPPSLNWKALGVVTSVKDQGDCGSCWAFASAAQAESTLILKGVKDLSIDLSEQYLLHCTQDSGCGGTYEVEHVMNLLKEGCPEQSQYPYQPDFYDSQICTETNKVFISDNYTAAYDLNDEQIISMLQNAPLIVTVHAGSWIFYSNGIFSCSISPSLDHVALLVGYTPQYWLIKNEWGTDFGEEGYIKVNRDPLYNCRIGSEVFMFDEPRCQLPGCKDCDVNRAGSCSVCRSPDAIIENGTCKCPEGLYFDEEGYCAPCQVYGCSQCSVYSYKCVACTSPNAVVQADICVCSDDNLVINRLGLCEPCQALGCERCIPGSPALCEICTDCAASLVDGLCECMSEGFSFSSSGICTFCTVPGCISCIEANTCEMCEQNLSLNNGSCNCGNDTDFFSSNLTCQECIVTECAECQNGIDEQKCAVCSNSSIIPNSEGVCQPCNSAICLSCRTSDPNYCEVCLGEDLRSASGRCLCKEGELMRPDGDCTPCIVRNCLYCLEANRITCEVCNEGMVFVDGECQCTNSSLSVNFQGLCELCSVEGCITCQVGQPSKCSKCMDCDNTYIHSGQCKCLLPDYDINGTGHCEPCTIPHCSRCLDQVCLECEGLWSTTSIDNHTTCRCQAVGNHLTEEGVCQLCSVAHCKECSNTDQNVCETCQAHRVPSNDSSKCQCESGMTDTSMGFCKIQEIFQEGFFLSDSGDYLQCSSHCRRCTDATTCTFCFDLAFYLTNGTCEQCHSTCKTCSGGSDTECLTCFSGKYLTGANSCAPCQLTSNSIMCNNAQQTTCMEGYYLDSSNLCAPCIDNCLECLDSTTCAVCKYGHSLAPSSQPKCIECLSSCLECNPDRVSQCLMCMDGFYLLENSCYSCIQNCDTCDHTHSCLKCSRGYFYSESADACLKDCSFPCTNCSWNRGTQVCHSCHSGYQLVNSICYSDRQCFTNRSCEACAQKLYRNPSTGVCDLCQTNNTSCLRCQQSNPSQCQRCNYGYALVDGQCEACSGSCSECIGTPEMCTECMDGYYLVSEETSGLCKQCSPRCLTCEKESTHCIQCNHNYEWLMEGQGWKCISQTRINFVYEIDCNFDSFFEHYKELKEYLINILDELDVQISHDEISIMTLTSGSTIIHGGVEVNQDNQQRINTRLSAVTQEQFMGFSILGASINELNSYAVYDNEVQEVNERDESSVSAGWVIGLTLASILILIVLAIFLYKKLAKGKISKIPTAQISQRMKIEDNEISYAN